MVCAGQGCTYQGEPAAQVSTRAAGGSGPRAERLRTVALGQGHVASLGMEVLSEHPVSVVQAGGLELPRAGETARVDEARSHGSGRQMKEH